MSEHKSNFLVLKFLNTNYFFLFIILAKKTSVRKSNKKPATKKDDLDMILKQPGEKTCYVPTKFGAMKIMFKDYLFTHHYSRNRVARYRCEAFEKSKCPATIFVFNSMTYPGASVEHNHAASKK